MQTADISLTESSGQGWSRIDRGCENNYLKINFSSCHYQVFQMWNFSEFLDNPNEGAESAVAR